MVVVDNLLIVHLATATPANHLSVLMLTNHKWHLCSVHLEEVALEEALEVDLVVALLTHTHPLEIETERETQDIHHEAGFELLPHPQQRLEVSFLETQIPSGLQWCQLG